MTYQEVLHLIEELGLEVVDHVVSDDINYQSPTMYVRFKDGVMLTVEGEGSGVELSFALVADNRHMLHWPVDLKEDDACNAIRPRNGMAVLFEGQLHFLLDSCVRRMLT